ncbi:MAG: rod shape-determining protein MreC [Rikenellaceae bacterium]|nr:rod shape-determining protein MreC [Rikenellaceae bacterium]
MIKFFGFLKRIYVFLLFIALEALAIHFYANSTSYARAQLVSASNRAVGHLQAGLAGVTGYLRLREENRALMEEIARLHNSPAAAAPTTGADTVVAADSATRASLSPYRYSTARVVRNSITRQDNFITIDKGFGDGIEEGMAIIAPSGMPVGYVLGCSDKFAVCMSVLNREFRASGKIKGSEFFGSLYWDGRSYEYLMLSEIPKYAEIAVGDTIVTTDYSSRFPQGLPIGTVESFELREATYYDVRVRLASPVGALRNVFVIRYEDAAERRGLEEELTGQSY